MSTDREIIVVGGSGEGRLAALQTELQEAMRDFWGVGNYIYGATTAEPKELIEYEAPPVFEVTNVTYNRNIKPKRKGKTPRKKQNGYF